MENIKKITVILLCVCLIFHTSTITSAATEKSDGKNMEKLLKCYKKKQLKKARKHNKKLSKYVHEKCVKNMPSAMEEAYRHIIAKSPVFDPDEHGEIYLWEYYVTDIDNDHKAELIRVIGSGEADVVLDIWKYKKGRAVKLGETYSPHSSFCAYPNHKGIIRVETHMGNEAIYLVKIKKGKVINELIGRRYLKKGNYIAVGCNLKRDYFSMMDL